MFHPLILTAISIGLIHTLLGPDHYLPFVALSKANHWSLNKTLRVSFICGLAHCLSSVLLGFLGIGLGMAVGKLETIENFRGDIASYLMIAFGIVYLAWSIKSFFRNRHHDQLHIMGLHHHHTEDDFIKTKQSQNVFWGIFIVFLFGPCEPLIPILMYPASKGHWAELLSVTTAFTFTTVLTKLTVIFLSVKGISAKSFDKFNPYSHIFASATIIICGLLIVFGL